MSNLTTVRRKSQPSPQEELVSVVPERPKAPCSPPPDYTSGNPFVNFLREFIKQQRDYGGESSRNYFKVAGLRWGQMAAEARRPYTEAAAFNRRQRVNEPGQDRRPAKTSHVPAAACAPKQSSGKVKSTKKAVRRKCPKRVNRKKPRRRPRRKPEARPKPLEQSQCSVCGHRPRSRRVADRRVEWVREVATPTARGNAGVLLMFARGSPDVSDGPTPTLLRHMGHYAAAKHNVDRNIRDLFRNQQRQAQKTQRQHAQQQQRRFGNNLKPKPLKALKLPKGKRAQAKESDSESNRSFSVSDMSDTQYSTASSY